MILERTQNVTDEAYSDLLPTLSLNLAIPLRQRNPPSIQNVALLEGRAVLLIRNPFEAAISAFTHWEGNSVHSLSVTPLQLQHGSVFVKKVARSLFFPSNMRVHDNLDVNSAIISELRPTDEGRQAGRWTTTPRCGRCPSWAAPSAAAPPSATRRASPSAAGRTSPPTSSPWARASSSSTSR